MKAVRLFRLLDCLRTAREPLAAHVLAADLGVSERTIYRDMVTLQAIGAPVRGEAGIGYQLEPDFFLPPLQFDADELDAIRIGLRLAGARGDTALAKAAGRAIGKIAAVLKDGKGDAFADAPWRAVSRLPGDPSGCMTHLASLRKAIREHQLLRVGYLDLSGHHGERTCRPLGLTAFDGSWLLTVWCELRNDFRNLRVDRIGLLETTGRVFKSELGKRFDDYLRRLPTDAQP